MMPANSSLHPSGSSEVEYQLTMHAAIHSGTSDPLRDEKIVIMLGNKSTRSKKSR